MRIRANLSVLALAAVVLPLQSATAPAPDAFLDRTIPAGPVYSIEQPKAPTSTQLNRLQELQKPCYMVQFETFRDRLDALNRSMPCPVELPTGLSDFISEIDRHHDPKNTIESPFEHEGSGIGDSVAPTYRSFLVDSCLFLNLAWRYDAERNVVTTDFKWRRDDPRSPQELLRFLSDTKPMPTDDVGWPSDKSLGFDTIALDPWRQALDALISKPENFPRAWKLRFLDDTKSSGLCPSPGSILWHGAVRNEQGRPLFVVVKYHPTFSMPGPLASFVIYAFDSNGRLASGELMTDRYENIQAPRLALGASGKSLDFYRLDYLLGAMTLGPRGPLLEVNNAYQGDELGKALFRIADN